MARMSIEDGLFLAAELERGDLADAAYVHGALQTYEDRRKPHTRQVSEQACWTGRIFHRLPRPLRPLRREATPRHILSRLAEIDEVERRAGRAPMV
jgi:2-polyprenyl-6-methoxyphenol hydroxylase-like FAD-dependent oxidoreductase